MGSLKRARATAAPAGGALSSRIKAAGAGGKFQLLQNIASSVVACGENSALRVCLAKAEAGKWRMLLHTKERGANPKLSAPLMLSDEAGAAAAASLQLRKGLPSSRRLPVRLLRRCAPHARAEPRGKGPVEASAMFSYNASTGQLLLNDGTNRVNASKKTHVETTGGAFVLNKTGHEGGAQITASEDDRLLVECILGMLKQEGISPVHFSPAAALAHADMASK